MAGRNGNGTRVVVTGMGVVAANAVGVPEFEKDPKPVLAKLAAARAKAPAKEDKPVTAPPAGEHGGHGAH